MSIRERDRLEVMARVIKRQQERYPDFGPTFACEKLTEVRLVVNVLRASSGQGAGGQRGGD